ncbi:uncharacterized protein JCM6883_001782 [Sporobolomyces salmoneus]|uniref:uncharacterized protein n=1 Tax=Sporobolomyces salmoneus TaxID=183962 RepID=UPI00316C13E9
MLSYDLDLISQLLNELNHDELKTSPSIKFALSQHSSRLGIDIEELLNLDVRKDKNGSSSPSSSSNSSSSSFEPAEDDVEDAKSGATYRPPSGSNSEVAQAEPCNPRQTRSTFKILDSNGTRDSCSPSPQALPSPLPPFSNRVVDPVAYHFPRHCRSGMQEGGVRG